MCKVNVEVKQIKLESVYRDAYIDRYRRLGYSVASESESEEDGKTYCAINLQRDRDDPAYEKLAEIEAEVDELCRKARAASDAPDEQKTRRKRKLAAMFVAGVAVMVAGMALVVGGLFAADLALALSGWGCAVAGAVLMIVWSCLRESWRLRRVDLADDAAHPGFGIDVYSRKVEECLKRADVERAAALSR